MFCSWVACDDTVKIILSQYLPNMAQKTLFDILAERTCSLAIHFVADNSTDGMDVRE